MKIHSIDDAHAIGESEVLLVCMWRTVTTLEAIAKLKESAQRMAKGKAGRVAFFTVVEADAEMPDTAVRDALAAMFRSVSDSVICSALVFEGQGFRAAAVRGITTGINLVARQPFPHKVFSNVDEGATWMAKQSDGHISIASVVTAVAEVRSALNERS
jgi:hypothetical protein